MQTTTLVIATFITVPVIALCAWAWITVARIDRQLRAGFEGMHFDM